MSRRRGSISLLSVLITMMFLAVFLLLPILRFVFPRFNSYFGFIPIFFFLPFFWSFKGRRRISNTQKNGSTTTDSSDFSSSGSMGDTQDSIFYDSSLSRPSMWGFAKYLAMAVVIALGVVLYFAFF